MNKLPEEAAAESVEGVAGGWDDELSPDQMDAIRKLAGGKNFDEIYIQFAERDLTDGTHIRKWSTNPFDGGERYTRPEASHIDQVELVEQCAKIVDAWAEERENCGDEEGAGCFVDCAKQIRALTQEKTDV